MTITQIRPGYKRCPGLDGTRCGRPVETHLDLCDGCDADKANAERIVELRGYLDEDLRQATTSTGSALTALRDLAGSSVYDVEVAEGVEGDDLRHELEAAARHLRNARRLIDAHLKTRKPTT